MLPVAGFAPLRPTRREFLIGAGSFLVLGATGCGSGGESGEETSGETRVVEHALGTAGAPVSPERVVVMDGEFTLNAVVALGVDPIGAARPDYTGGIPEQIRRRIESELPEVGTISEPNLERIASLEPGLIIGATSIIEGVYGRLAKIAPTVVLDYEQTLWKEQLRKMGRVLGRRNRSEQLLEDYEARAARIGEELSNRLDELTVTVARATDLGFRYPRWKGLSRGRSFGTSG